MTRKHRIRKLVAKRLRPNLKVTQKLKLLDRQYQSRFGMPR